MLKLLNFLKGYIIIKVCGNFPEKFINIALSKGIYIWDISQKAKDVYIMKMNPKAFLLLKGSSVNCGCKVSVIEKKGLFFTLKRIRNKYAYIVGMLLFFAVILFSSSIITDIYIEGNENISNAEIIGRLSDCGLKKGMFKAMVDTKETEKLFKISSEDVSFIAININGTKAYVQIAEARKKPFIEEKEKAYDIISDYDGVIESIRTRSGFQVVNQGDSVYKGQLLVSGIGDSKFLTVRYVNSNADIVIRNWKSYIKEFPLIKTISFPTGKKNNSYEIYFCGNKIKNAKPKFENYSQSYKKTYKIGNVLEINKISFAEEVKSEEKLSVENAFSYYYPIFLEEIKSSLKKDCKVLNIKNNYAQNSDKIRIWIELETLNNGGVKKEIKKDEIINGEIN